MDPTTRIEGQWSYGRTKAHGSYGLQEAHQSVCCHDYFGLVTKNRLLWPLEKNRKRTAVTTSKQLNKTIRKQSSPLEQAIKASLLLLLHILHPLGIKVHHQCKYREQSSILHTLGRQNWPPVQINAAAKQEHNWNNFRRAQETLSWVSTMLAISLASWLALSCLALKSSNACCCTRKYACECSRDFHSPSASCRSTADRCL